MTQPTRGERGERNNNPLNLEDMKIPWDGMLKPNDGPYLRFVTAEKGIRAGARDLHTKVTVHKLATLRQLVPVFAPKVENNVEAYIVDLERWCAISRDDDLPADQPAFLQLLTTGFIHHECGRVVYPEELVAQSVADALADNDQKGHYR